MHSGPPSFTETPWAKKNKEDMVKRGRKRKEGARDKDLMLAGEGEGRSKKNI